MAPPRVHGSLVDRMAVAERMAIDTRTGSAGECWIWTGTKTHGYGIIRVTGRGNQRAHRIAYELAHGRIDDGAHVLHRCDNPACVNPSHLFLGTQGDNNRDASTKGRSARGERNAKAKLTEADVAYIRHAKSVGKYGTTITLARAFGVTEGTITAIVRGANWRHVPR